MNKEGKIEIKGRKGGDKEQVGRSILGKRKFCKKRESVRKLVSLFRNFHRKMNNVNEKEMKMIYKKMLCVVGGSILLGLSNLAAPARGAENITLTVAVHAGGHATPFYETKGEFEARFPNVTIEVVEIVVTEMYNRQLVEMVGETGGFDIVEYAPRWKGDYFPYLVPIDDYMKENDPDWDDVLPTVRESYSVWKGKTYGLPEDGDVLNLYYRKDIIAKPEYQARFKAKYGYELQPPKTWKEYVDVAEFFNGWDWDNDGEIEYGCAPLIHRGEAFYWFLLRFQPMGGKYFLADGKPGINTPAGIEALENLKKAAENAPPGALNFSYTETEHAFISGQVLMTVTWGGMNHAAIDPNVSDVVGKIGYALAPGVKLPDGTIRYSPTLAYGWVLGIVNTCEAPDIAYEYIRYLTSPETSKKFLMASNTDTDPFRYSHTTDPEIISGLEHFYKIAKEGMELGYPELDIPMSEIYLDLLDKEVTSYLAGKKTAEKALNDAAKEWIKTGPPPYAPIPAD